MGLQRCIHRWPFLLRFVPDDRLVPPGEAKATLQKRGQYGRDPYGVPSVLRIVGHKPVCDLLQDAW